MISDPSLMRRKAEKRITVAEISRRSGLARNTIKKALAGEPVRQTTRNAIIQAIEGDAQYFGSLEPELDAVRKALEGILEQAKRSTTFSRNELQSAHKMAKSANEVMVAIQRVVNRSDYKERVWRKGLSTRQS